MIFSEGHILRDAACTGAEKNALMSEVFAMQCSGTVACVSVGEVAAKQPVPRADYLYSYRYC